MKQTAVLTVVLALGLGGAAEASVKGARRSTELAVAVGSGPKFHAKAKCVSVRRGRYRCSFTLWERRGQYHYGRAWVRQHGRLHYTVTYRVDR
jgi:hypothetical protein